MLVSFYFKDTVEESVAAVSEDRQGQGQQPSESDRSHDNASVTMPLAYRRSDYG